MNSMNSVHSVEREKTRVGLLRADCIYKHCHLINEHVTSSSVNLLNVLSRNCPIWRGSIRYLVVGLFFFSFTAAPL